MSFYDDILFLVKARANLDTESGLTQRGVFFIGVEGNFFEASLAIEPFSNGEKIIIKLIKTDPTEEENSGEDPDQWLKDLGSDSDPENEI